MPPIEPFFILHSRTRTNFGILVPICREKKVNRKSLVETTTKSSVLITTTTSVVQYCSRAACVLLQSLKMAWKFDVIRHCAKSLFSVLLKHGNIRKERDSPESWKGFSRIESLQKPFSKDDIVHKLETRPTEQVGDTKFGRWVK